MICKYPPCKNEVTQNNVGPRRLFCCEKCTRKHGVTEKRRRNKVKMVEHLGGSCARCGYTGHVAAMVPHHVDPTQKSFNLGDGTTKSWARIEQELNKCVLLCQNCHATVHATNDPEWVVIPV